MQILGGEVKWRASDTEGDDFGWIDGIVVEALAALPASHPGQDHSFEERRWGVTLLAVLGEHDLGDLVGRIQPDEVEQSERPHWIAAPELHRLVDIRHAPHAALYRPDRVEQIRDEQQIDDEAGGVLRGHGLLAERPGEREGAFKGLCRGGYGPNDLHEWHERHGIEEMQADEAVSSLRGRRHRRDREARGVRGEDGGGAA